MKIDMSAHAVTMRLKKTSELRSLCIALGSGRLRSKMGRSASFSAGAEPSQQSRLGEDGKKG